MFAETILNVSAELLRLFLRFQASSRGKMTTFAYLHPSLTITEKNSESLLLFAREARVHPYPLLQIEQQRCPLTNDAASWSWTETHAGLDLVPTYDWRTLKYGNDRKVTFLTVKFTTKLPVNQVCPGNKTSTLTRTPTPAAVIRTPLLFHFLSIFYDISRLTWRCTFFSRSYLADPFNDCEVNPPEATASFSSLLKGHWTPELLKTVQSKEMPNLSPVHSAAPSVFMNELYTTRLLNSPSWLKGVE